MGGSETANSSNNWVTFYHVFFNKLAVTDINIFEYRWGSQMANQFDENSTFGKLRTNIASWYYGIRNLAVVILLVVLIYVGIRMAISTVAEEEAKYKTMLKDWFVALVLVFMLHIIIIATIYVNNEIVRALDPAGTGGELQANTLVNYQGSLLEKTWSLGYSWTYGLATGILYSVLAGVSFGFLVMYIKRMITIAFLTLIAPIITITYPIDKMGDGKSQALNNWLKEFMFNVLIQPFHCLLYLIFVSSALEMLNGTLAGGIFAIITVIFVYQAEGIIRKIFGFGGASTLGNAAGSAAILYSGIKLAENLGKKKSDGKESGKGQSKGEGSGNNSSSRNAEQNRQGAEQAGNAENNSESQSNQSSPRPKSNPYMSGKRRFARTVAKVGKVAGKGALRAYGKGMKLAAGAGLAAVGMGAGANAGEALVMGKIGSAAASATGGALTSVASHVPIRNMANNKNQARFEKQLNQMMDRYPNFDPQDFIKQTYKNSDEFRKGLEEKGKEQERKLAARIWDYRDTLEKLGDTSAEESILKRAKEIVDKR